MAGEITARGTLTALKGGVNISVDTGKLTINMAGADAAQYTQLLTTSEAALLIPAAITTLGWCLIVNNDATNFVKVRPATGAADLIKILPTEFALFRMAASAPFAIADTASCQITVTMIEA